MNWINILSALLTPAIGATTAYVAWQQWQSARLKLRLDLYDRRARIYGEVCTFLSAVLSNATISVSDVRQLRSGTAEVEFLFEPDIAQYIDLVMKHAMALAAATLKYDANLKHTYAL